MNIDIIMEMLIAMERKTKDPKEKIALRAAVELLHCIDLIGFNLWAIKELIERAEIELCEKESEENNG